MPRWAALGGGGGRGEGEKGRYLVATGAGMRNVFLAARTRSRAG